MMTNYALNEHSYLQSRVDDQMPIFCWLANGIRLVGVLQAHDNDAIFIMGLECKDCKGTIMVMKQQIASITTMAAAKMYRGHEHSSPDQKPETPNGKRRTCMHNIV
jgi:sRNA-binding regulator protein Hfq